MYDFAIACLLPFPLPLRLLREIMACVCVRLLVLLLHSFGNGDVTLSTEGSQSPPERLCSGWVC